MLATRQFHRPVTVPSGESSECHPLIDGRIVMLVLDWLDTTYVVLRIGVALS